MVTKKRGFAIELEGALSPAKSKRPRRVMLSLSEEEYGAVKAFADARGEPLAAAARSAVLAAVRVFSMKR
jgi:hypothetical protein